MSRIAAYNPVHTDATLRALVSGQPDFIDITTPSTAGEEIGVPHGMGRVPKGFAVVKSTYTGTAMDAGDSGTTWTTTTIYLKFSQTSVAVTIAVF